MTNTDTRNRLRIVENDPWLVPVEAQLDARYERYRARLEEIVSTAGSLKDYANGYRYFGFQRDERAGGWWFREWLPGATDVFLFGDFNGWNRTSLPLARGADGIWSIFLHDGQYGRSLRHGSLVKMLVHGDNGWRERIPAYIRRVVQDEESKNYNGQFWNPEPFDWQGDAFDLRSVGAPLIYECHIGMAQEKEGVGTFEEFGRKVLPRIKRLGYNVIQLMGVAEHPYYGSFGYHVSNFFAPSSRFGTPEDLKRLIRKAHGMGIGVVMDLVHAHYVKNINEGLNELDGSDSQYSPSGAAGRHPFWDSMLFDYGKPQVTHFLLSNVKYWLDEFHFDGYRFDGVTSMIYRNHGLMDFGRREHYFDDNVNGDALCYLTLANNLVHELRPDAMTVAEDVSGMPGMCIPIHDGGVGFDYRLAMAVPDFWIRLLEDVPDEQWDIWQIWNILTERLPSVGTIAYAESHDQALVGDKTIAFRLMDKDMYADMSRDRQNLLIDRGMALHKMIRLATISLGGQGYLNFMGNEFGHPDWIDFPREGNGWSYTHARRQWSLVDNPLLRYGQLNDFDRAMIRTVRRCDLLRQGFAYNLSMDQAQQTMAFAYPGLIFVFNWSPSSSMPDYEIPVLEPGMYRVLLSTDDARFGGQQRHDHAVKHFTYSRQDGDGMLRHYLKIYNVTRTAVIYKKV